MQCPKCHAMMHTYNRAGVQIEQCGACRGIFLDYGELEALTRMESGYSAPPATPRFGAPPMYGAPVWGAPRQGYGHYKHKHKNNFGKMLFSS
ncbi:zf-TFIIB domain-containing protein [Nocardia uniformis]|uniref:Zf-TFIIB domain-containing protein n=1 Tax=Nocardia uniformis TaxID=53432 RepID=A0A849BUN9_9NOCA|nr:zf-TFIIB domain-containing protein [Nocardia uniformis]NNH69894.1 zf-TFIIB domain-containing protein [Nocardia uniformis]